MDRQEHEKEGLKLESLCRDDARTKQAKGEAGWLWDDIKKERYWKDIEGGNSLSDLWE